MEKTRAVKVQFGDDIRRFSLPDESFETLRAIIQDAFPELRDTKEWKIKYKDEDGDMVTIMTGNDLPEALQSQELLRLVITINAPKAGEEPQPHSAPASSREGFDLAGSMNSFFSACQNQSASSAQSCPSPFEPKIVLQLSNLLSVVPQLLSDQTLINAIPGLLAAFQNNPTILPSLLATVQQNPALLEALPQLLNVVASNPALLNMLPVLLGTLAPTKPAAEEKADPTPQEPSAPPAPQQPPPQYQPSQSQPQPPQYQPSQMQQPQYQQSYTPQPWGHQPTPNWQPQEFQPQPQPNIYVPMAASPPAHTTTTFSFCPTLNQRSGEGSPSFTFQSSHPHQYQAPLEEQPQQGEPFHAELVQLQAMGFGNVQTNRHLLQKNRGDLVLTVQDLTSGM